MLINSTGLYGAGVELMATQVNLPGDIEADKVTSLVVDSQGILWLGTPSG